MLTRPGWVVLAGAAAALAAGRLFGVVELFVLAATALALLVLSLAWVWGPVPQLEISRRITPPRVSVGGTGRVEVRVANPSRRPVSHLTLVDPVQHTVGARLEVGRLGGGMVRTVGYRIPTGRRGLLHLGPLVARRTDPFGLARRLVAGPGPDTVTVLPAIDDLPATLAGSGRREPLAGAARRTIATSGVDDLATLRPYVVGDDLRRVHWPSTARTDDLQVRRDEEPWQGHLTVVLDGRLGVLGPDDFERAVSAAGGLVHAVAEAGDRVRLVVTDGTDSGMVDGRRASGTLLETLAVVDQHPADRLHLAPPDARHDEPVVLVTGPTEPGPLAAALEQAGYGHARIVRFGAPPGDPGDPHIVDVGPDESVGRAWTRHPPTPVAGRR